MRYSNKIPKVNSSKQYSDFFSDRGVNYIEQYTTPTLNYPTPGQISNLSLIDHTWGHGDMFYKLAYRYYGESKYWWVISWFNKKPTESHVVKGQKIIIPTPLEKILSYYDY
jgi:nucleoid-associated protein YgaU